MLIRLRKLQDDLRSSLFFVPMLFVVGAVVLGEVMLRVDERVDDIPRRLTATVASARNVLEVVAGATLAFAGIAFSVSVLLISLASSQYSPRVVHGLFRDPFNKRIMGVVIGTFTYCLVVLRSVRGPLEDSGQAVVPSVSILLAVVLGIVSVLAIIAFISHSAHSMDVSRILHRVTEEALDQLSQLPEEAAADDDLDPPSGDGFEVTFDAEGWIQQIDRDALLEALEPGGCMQLATAAGRYAVPDVALCTVWPEPADPDAAQMAIRATVVLGESRTMQQDVGYGIRQLADVALKALSPGVNDPTTAQDALFHLGAVLRPLLVRSPPCRRLTGPDDRVLLLPEAPTHEDLVGLAFDEIRIASADEPTVQIYVLEVLHLLTASLPEDRTEARAALGHQADLVLEISQLGEHTEHDHDRVRSAHRQRFG